MAHQSWKLPLQTTKSLIRFLPIVPAKLISLQCLASKSKTKRRGHLTSSFPLLNRGAFANHRLRQCFDIQQHFEGSRLLDPKEESNINGRAVCYRGSQGDNPCRPRRVKSATIWLGGRLFESRTLNGDVARTTTAGRTIYCHNYGGAGSRSQVSGPRRRWKRR